MCKVMLPHAEPFDDRTMHNPGKQSLYSGNQSGHEIDRIVRTARINASSKKPCIEVEEVFCVDLGPLTVVIFVLVQSSRLSLGVVLFKQGDL
jgi:hypothetical protein